MGHVRETAVEAEEFVSRIARAGHMVGHAHVVGETESTGIFRGVSGEAHLVAVGEAFHKPVELIPHDPRIHRHLEEEVVHRQVESVHHAILALVNHPEWLTVTFEEFRAAVVAPDRMRELEPAVLGQSLETLIKRGRQGFLVVKILQRERGHGFDIGEKAVVKIPAGHAAGDMALAVEADRKADGSFFSRRHIGHEKAGSAKTEDEIFWAVWPQAFARRESEAGENSRGIGHNRRPESLPDSRKRAQIVQSPHRRVSVAALVAEERPAGGFPLAVVDRQLRKNRRDQCLTKRLFFGLGRVWHRFDGGIHGEYEVSRRPSVHASTHLALDRFPGNRSQSIVGRRCGGCYIVARAFIRTSCKERQGLEAGFIGRLQANVEVFVGRAAKFEAEASFGSGKSKGERGEGSDRGVLGVVSDGHGWVISCWEE